MVLQKLSKEMLKQFNGYKSEQKYAEKKFNGYCDVLETLLGHKYKLWKLENDVEDSDDSNNAYELSPDVTLTPPAKRRASNAKPSPKTTKKRKA